MARTARLTQIDGYALLECARNHKRSIHISMYVCICDIKWQLVSAALPGTKKEENKGRRLDSSGSSSMCRVSSAKSKRMSINIMRLWTAAWQYRGPWAHIYTRVYVCIHTDTRTVRYTQQADPDAHAKCQRLSLCLHAAALAWPGLACPFLPWPGLACPGLDHVWLWAF